MDQDQSWAVTAEEKSREQQIQAAKKKLKSFRAKQAQQARVKRGSQPLTPASAKRISTNIATAVESEIVRAAQESHSHARIPSGPSASLTSLPSTITEQLEGSQSRRASRIGHGRGHSRAGSISITADSMALTAAAALHQSLQAAHPPFSNNRQSASGVPASRPPSIITTKPSLSSSTNSRSHSRAHSRSGSRTNIRPPSMIALSGQMPTLLAAEYGPESFGGPGKPADWADVEDERSSRGPSLRTESMRFSTQSNTTNTPLASLPTSDSLLSISNQEALQASPAKQARRQSRHVRNPSLTTKRESMEIMGGLGFTPNVLQESSRSSRHMNRNSGIQSASVLFGGSADSRRSATDFDWRGAFQLSEKDAGADSDDRRTALEKLEGRTTDPLSAYDHHTASRRRGQVLSRPSSVQLPSFDDIHGSEGIDKPCSTHLLQANERTTLEERGPSSPMPAWLAPPVSSSGLAAGDLSTSKSPKIRPHSVYGTVDTPQPEGLGTLIEEEEEEENSAASPTVAPLSPNAFDTGRSAVEDEEAQRQRKAIEEETIKRTRRSSLQPRPLKLKSRPASLFVTPSMQQKLALIATPTLETSEASESDGDKDSPGLTTTSTPTESPPTTSESQPGQLARAWSMTAAQARTTSPTSSSTAKPGMRALRLGSLSTIGTSSAVDSSATVSPKPVSTMARQRASLLYNYSASASGSSYDEPVSTPATPLSGNPRRRSAILYKAPLPGHFMPATAASVAEAPDYALLVEELKAKSAQDAVAAEGMRAQIEALTSQLTAEAECASSQYSRLEAWSAGQNETFENQILSLQAELKDKAAALTQSTEALINAEKKRQEARDDAEGRIEDLEAERDMLQDDVDGWRTRCGDLEKSLKSDRAVLEAERSATAALKVRMQILTDKLHEAGIKAPTDSLSTEEQLGISADLMMALKTPASFDASSTSPSGYFSPHITASDPPPQAVRLLKDMRQQIFNLAGSLEHERKEHLQAQKFADGLKEENAKLKIDLRQARSSSELEKAAQQGAKSGESGTISLQGSSVTSFTMERRPVGPGSKAKRHAFAYDSSMGSADQSISSMGSGATSMTSMTNTADTTAQEEKEADNYEGLLSDKILPQSGGLQPLLEEDEIISAATEQIEGEDDTQSVSDQGTADATADDEQAAKHGHGLSSLDLEAGGEPGHWNDAEEDEEVNEGLTESDLLKPVSCEGTQSPSHRESTSEIFQTPAMESIATFPDVIPTNAPMRGVEGQVLSSGSTSGLVDADATSQHSSVIAPSYNTRSANSSVSSNEIETPSLAQGGASEDYDDAMSNDVWYDETEAIRLDAARPEFIRDWSFQDALHAVKARKGGPLTMTSLASKQWYQDSSGLRRRKPRPSSIDDFFGLMLYDKLEPLPPLPTTYASLDMPPVYIEHYYHDQEVPPYGEAVPMAIMSGVAGGVGRRTASGGSNTSHGSSIGAPSSTRQASIFGFGSAARARPPIARSAYVRDSASSLDSGLTDAGSKSSSNASGRGSLVDYGSTVALGSTAIARMSLQSLSSAFSGLGGYLAGQSGAAVHAAAAATTMCTKGDVTSDSRNPSLSWTIQPSPDRGGPYDEEAAEETDTAAAPGGFPHGQLPSVLKPVGGMSSGGAKRYSSTPMSSTPIKARLSNSQASAPLQQKLLSAQQQQEQQLRLRFTGSPRPTGASGKTSGQGAHPRRFISRAGAAKPFASPVWTLDFVKSTEVSGGAAIFSV